MGTIPAVKESLLHFIMNKTVAYNGEDKKEARNKSSGSPKNARGAAFFIVVSPEF